MSKWREWAIKNKWLPLEGHNGGDWDMDIEGPECGVTKVIEYAAYEKSTELFLKNLEKLLNTEQKLELEIKALECAQEVLELEELTCLQVEETLKKLKKEEND